VQAKLVDDLRGKVGQDRLDAAAAAFSDSHPEPPGLFDLGQVPADVARRAGYDCLVGT